MRLINWLRAWWHGPYGPYDANVAVLTRMFAECKTAAQKAEIAGLMAARLAELGQRFPWQSDQLAGEAREWAAIANRYGVEVQQ